ncbi:unnamed protein product [Cyprideis torosa]|uniref:Uncharacterized protein n=1 Tax=Cyprideis torosa TaxID=163714 RepID=A0A7R8ZTZ9_9CRUS|nr:unnamed protein product [Cyprideis torosa]CAG0905087.1 unnamed protein product [Cyprideis torosa]
MSENKVYTAIGMMSGTSLDGIDMALVRTDGKDFTKLEDFKTVPYSDEVRAKIKEVFGQRHASDKTAEVEKLVTAAHIQAIKDFGHEADVIGFHGQTILHDPSQKFTWQIGCSKTLADATGMDVVGDMRIADIKAGGQGAPLLPLCHRAFASEAMRPIAILNLGGVGNVTWLGEERQDILAFDTGPANALIDDLVKEKTGKHYDSDGKIAKAGKVHQKMVDDWLNHKYFDRPVPKSLDRDEWQVARVYDLPLEDAVATLAAFTVQSVMKSFENLPAAPKAVYVAGGGRHNKYIMEELNRLMACDVEPVESLNWNGDAVEAKGFAYLAVRSLLGLALTLPTTTGVPKPMTGGVLYKALDKKLERAAGQRKP